MIFAANNGMKEMYDGMDRGQGGPGGPGQGGMGGMPMPSGMNPEMLTGIS